MLLTLAGESLKHASNTCTKGPGRVSCVLNYSRTHSSSVLLVKTRRSNISPRMWQIVYSVFKVKWLNCQLDCFVINTQKNLWRPLGLFVGFISVRWSLFLETKLGATPRFLCENRSLESLNAIPINTKYAQYENRMIARHLRTDELRLDLHPTSPNAVSLNPDLCRNIKMVWTWSLI